MTARKLLALPLAFSGGVALASFAGCTETNDNHCASRGGDEYCQEKTGKAAGEVFCTNNCGGDYDIDGCLVASEAPAEGCWLCDGQGSENCDGMAEESGSDSDTTTDTDSDSESMSETATETGPELCEGPQDCTDPAQPFCTMAGDCVACDAMPDPDAACVGADPNLPVCVGSSCVACAEGKTDACTGTTPICDTLTNECEGCSNHDQCADTACNFDAGNCIDSGAVVHVDGDFQNCGASDGSEAMPYCTVGAALAGAGAETLVILHERDGQNPYVEANTVTLTVAIFAAVGENPILQGFNNNPALTVSPTGNLMLRDVRISNGPDYGIEVNGGDLWLEGCEVRGNAGGGVLINDGTASFVRSKVTSNMNAGIHIVDGNVSIWSSFVGVSIADVPGMSVAAGNVEIVYTSVVGGTAASPALFCNQGGGVVIRNSMVVSRDAGPEVVCAGAQVTGSALEMEIQGNTVLGVMPDGSWFANYNGGDFHLSAMAPTEIATSATWQTGDPATDIDGDPRPATDGALDYAGADVP